MSINENTCLAEQLPGTPPAGGAAELARLLQGWPVLLTQLLRPQPPSPFVGRQELVQQLHRFQGHVCIYGRAGYGKTSLASYGCSTMAAATGWLSLDDEDNAPPRFALHLAAAYISACPHTAGRFRRSRADEPPVRPAEVVATILNENLLHDEAVVLVLDDYHRISEAEIHLAVNMLLERSSPRLQIMLLSRTRPPLRLAALQLQQRLLTLDMGQQALAADDCLEYLRHLCPQLDGEALLPLTAQLEGWPAGLRGLALFLNSRPGNRDLPDMEQLVSSGVITDYVWEQIVGQLPQALQQFLLQTAILDSFNAELCQAVTGCAHSAALLHDSVERQLFVSALDGQGGWYRYHALFQAWLVTRLRREQPDWPQLHVRAAQYWLQREDIARALEHALHSGQQALIADVLDHPQQTLQAQGHGELLQRAMLRLSDDTLCRRRRLLMLACRYWQQRDRDRVLQLVERASQLAREPASGLADADVEHVLAMVELYRAQVCFGREQIEAGVVHARAALAQVPEQDIRSRSEATALLAESLMLTGELRQANQSWQQAEQLARRAPTPPLIVWTLHQQAQLQLQAGEIQRCRELQQEASWLAQEYAIQGASSLWSLYRARAELALELFALDDCEEFCQRALQVCRYWTHDGQLPLVLIQARLQQLRGQTGAARETLLKAQELASRARQHSYVLSWLELTQAELNAGPPGSGYQGDDRDAVNEILQRRARARAIHRLQQGEAAQAEQQLTQLEQTAARHGLVLEQWQARLWRVVALELQQQDNEQLWQQVLDFAARRGLLGNLLLAAPLLRQRLQREDGLQDVALRHLRRVRDLLAHQRARPCRGSEVPAAMAALAMTARDWSVFQLLMQGAGNEEIAAQLHLALGTVKNTITRIYRKLDVNDRDAACRLGARALNLETA